MSFIPSRCPRSIGTQLLFAVNLTLGLAIVGLLGLRYEREMQRALDEKQANLKDEAIAIHAAVRHLIQEHRLSAVQEYLNQVCHQMCESRSPAHHIVVRIGEHTLRTGQKNTSSSQILAALKAAVNSPEQRSQFHNDILVVGNCSLEGIDVYTSENLAAIRLAVQRDVLTQLVAMAALGMVAAVIVNLVIHYVISVPLHNLSQAVEKIGKGQLGTKVSFSGSSEIQSISAAVNEMSKSLHRYELERRAQLKKAYEIQQHLLPDNESIPGMSSAHLFQPAEDVAGDYFDYLNLSDDTCLICVADVTGHGVPAAMGASMLKMLLLVASEQSDVAPASILRFINSRFVEATLPDCFASMFIAHWDASTQQLVYANAGHEPPYWLSGSSLETLSSTGLLLGIDTNADWTEQTIQLKYGDRLLLFSDGVIESQDPQGTLFGRSRLAKLISDARSQTSVEFVESVSKSLSCHQTARQFDDVTLVALDVSESQVKDAAVEKESQTEAA